MRSRAAAKGIASSGTISFVTWSVPPPPKQEWLRNVRSQACCPHVQDAAAGGVGAVAARDPERILADYETFKREYMALAKLFPQLPYVTAKGSSSSPL